MAIYVNTDVNMAITMPTLRVYGSVAHGKSNYMVSDLTRYAKEYSRTIRSQGGYWMGYFRLEGNVVDIYHIFESWLGFHFTESSGNTVTWEGQIYEMDMTWFGSVKRRSIDVLRNSWTAIYEDEGGIAQTTAAANDTASIARYGRYEDILTLDQSSATVAEAKRDTYLNRYSQPYSNGVSMAVKSSDFATIDITVAGYIFTANWQFESAGDGTQDDLSDWIKEIITTNCPFLSVGIISANSLLVYKRNKQPRRAWDVLQDLVEIGDINGYPYRLWVGNDRKVYYKIIDTTPVYYVHADHIYAGPTYAPSNISPWSIKPCVIRDKNWPGLESTSGGWLQSIKDFYASEISVSTSGGLSIRTELFDEGDILDIQVKFLLENQPPKDKE